HLGKSAGLAIMAALLGILVNAVTLFTTYEYAKKTIRGGSVLADSTTNVTKTGLSKDYALSYSIYKTEPLVMMFPKLYGGSTSQLEVTQDNSQAIAALQQMPQELAQQIQRYMQFYWGGINEGTSGPPYTGAIVCFLALIGFVIVDKKYTYWMGAAIVFTLMLSWGKYLEGFNIAMLKYLPVYDKFRAPSMILVVPTFLLCMLAALSLNTLINAENKTLLWEKYKKGLMVVAAVFGITVLVYLTADFSSAGDKMLMEQISKIPDATQRAQIEAPVKSFIEGLREDRKSLVLGDLLRTLLFCAVAGAAVFAAIKQKINPIIITAVIGIFAMIDVFGINSKYLNADNYQDAAEYENIFTPTAADQEILKDTSYYRVLNLTQGISNAFNAGALTAYFHKSVGGYHPAKLSIYQDLIENQLYKFPNCMPSLNMLNTKYLIMPDQQTGQATVQQNPNALGAAWLVKSVEFKDGPAAIMQSLTNFNPAETALLDQKDKTRIGAIQYDSTASIQLLINENDAAKYQYKSSSNQFAVFSEVFYDAGWKAYIDGKESAILQTNYVLRGMEIPAGNHTIEFKFEPASYAIGSKAAVGSSIIIWLLLLGAIVTGFKKTKTT
ncbi:MAG: hypothetical protein C0446_14345, partial [Chitinophaga sp.]|nr:hypothetical protein [Chitinophaga sp.]